MLWVVVLPHRILLLIVVLLGIFVCNGVNDDEFKTVDVAKLANNTQGTGNCNNFFSININILRHVDSN